MVNSTVHAVVSVLGSYTARLSQDHVTVAMALHLRPSTRETEAAPKPESRDNNERVTNTESFPGAISIPGVFASCYSTLIHRMYHGTR